MRKNRKKVLWALAGMLLFLLAFLQLTVCDSRVLSLETQSKTIGSSGLVGYQFGSAALLVTDSTPEGPVPFTVDGVTGYTTGDHAYNLTAGPHAVMMPSPYTAVSSGIEYEFVRWSDSEIANPRTVVLEVGTTTSLDAIYSVHASTTIIVASEYSDGTAWRSCVVSAVLGGVTKNTPATYSDLAAGSYTISVSSSYGSYLFNSWSDTGTNPSRTVTIARDETKSLTARYGTPPPIVGNDIAYTGFETARFWEQGNLPVYDVVEGSANNGFESGGCPENGGSQCYRVARTYPTCIRNALAINPSGSYAFANVYTSQWVKIRTWQTNIWSAAWNDRSDTPGFGEEITLIGIYGSQWYISHDHNPQDSGDYFHIDISPTGSYGWTTRGTLYSVPDGHEVPIGRWFKFEVWRKRDTTNGEFMAWMTDPQNPNPSKQGRRLLFSLTGARTCDSDSYRNLVSGYICPFTKEYGQGSTSSYTQDMLIDNLLIRDSPPSTASLTTAYVNTLYVYNYSAQEIVASNAYPIGAPSLEDLNSTFVATVRTSEEETLD